MTESTTTQQRDPQLGHDDRDENPRPEPVAIPPPEDERERLERKLDEAIEMTFPASDPLAI